MDNVVTLFMFYMYNIWSEEESISLFGDRLGRHIFNKWLSAIDESSDRNLYWYSNLDSDCRNRLVERVFDCYNKKKK